MEPRSGISTSSSQQASDSRPRPKKLRRSTRACDFCHRRSIRCKPSLESTRCQNCADFDVACTYDRPAKKRGVKAAGTNGDERDSIPSAGGVKTEDARHDASLLLHLTNENVHPQSQPSVFGAGLAGNGRVEADGLVRFSLGKEHREMVLKSSNEISALIMVYFDVIYPIFPLFHRKKLQRNIASKEYLKDKALFVAVMSLCSLASSRARDGALPSGRWDPSIYSQPSAEAFFAAAEDAIPEDIVAMRGFDYMRSCTLLALYGIQVGKPGIMHQYLGLYHTLVAMDAVQDEKNWPQNLGVIELEERRRTFWSTYTLEVHCSIVWGGVIRCREEQSRIAFPSEVDDEFITDEGFTSKALGRKASPSTLRMAPDSATDPSCWLHGWNFTTEMYRILEHAMNDFARRKPHNVGSFSPSDLFLKETPMQNTVLDKAMSMHAKLPSRFRETRDVASNMSEDTFSFQAANIAATLQLVRMVLFAADDATVEQKCGVALELLQGFSRVPLFFLRAISVPLVSTALSRVWPSKQTS